MGRSVEDARAGYVVVGGSGVLAPIGAALRAAGEHPTSISRGSRLDQGDWDERVALDARDADAVASWLETRDLLPRSVIAYAPATSPEAFALLVDGCEVAVLVVPTAWSDPADGRALAASWRLADDVRVLRLGWTGDAGTARWHTPEEISSGALSLAARADGRDSAGTVLGRVEPWSERPGAAAGDVAGSTPEGPLVIREEPWPAVTGAVGFAQGVYGDVGNLELVAADADGDGIWVGWWNADATDHRVGALPGSWSGAKKFADGRSYASVSITQAVAGPHFLEVLALSSGGVLDRYVWTPDQGFTDQGTVLDGVRSAAPVVVATDGDHWVVAATARGPVALRGRPAAAYPALELVTPDPDEAPAIAPLAGGSGRSGGQVVGAAWHEDHLDVLALEDDAALWSCAAGTAPVMLDTSRRVDSGSIAAQGNSVAAVWCAQGRASFVLLGAGHAPTDLGPASHATVTPVRPEPLRAPEWHVVTTNGPTLTHHRIAADGTLLDGDTVGARVWTSPDSSTVHGHL